MNSIVTGGAGFIGSHLTEHLLELGHKVTVIDNYSTGRPKNIEHLVKHPNLTVIYADINDYLTIAPHFENVHYVFHLAALADIVPSINRPVEYHRANVDGTFSVLEATKRSKVLKKFLYSASSSCYGIPDSYPTNEKAEIRPQYPYALTKNLGESYVMHWSNLYKIPAIALRLFNVYGPRSRTSGTYGAVFGVFLAQKIAGKPFTVVGDGTQTRDFTFVKDIVNAFYAASQSELTGEIFNVGSGHTYPVNRLIQLLDGPVTYIPKRPGEPDCTFADTSKISARLRWKPQFTLEAGVKIMLENIDYWKEAPVWTPDTIREATADWFKYLGANK